MSPERPISETNTKKNIKLIKLIIKVTRGKTKVVRTCEMKDDGCAGKGESGRLWGGGGRFEAESLDCGCTEDRAAQGRDSSGAAIPLEGKTAAAAAVAQEEKVVADDVSA